MELMALKFTIQPNWIVINGFKRRKLIGAQYMVLVCKHHDGFCNWQTATTDYSVKSSSWRNGEGDTVREFVEACRSANMRFGLYLSPWDRHEPKYKDKDAYDKF